MYLIEEQLSPLLFPQIHLLHGNLSPCCAISGDTNYSCRAFSYFYKGVQILPRIAWTHNHLQCGTELNQTK
jgi:hypothetical protein